MCVRGVSVSSNQKDWTRVRGAEEERTKLWQCLSLSLRLQSHQAGQPERTDKRGFISWDDGPEGALYLKLLPLSGRGKESTLVETIEK